MTEQPTEPTSPIDGVEVEEAGARTAAALDDTGDADAQAGDPVDDDDLDDADEDTADTTGTGA